MIEKSEDTIRISDEKSISDTYLWMYSPSTLTIYSRGAWFRFQPCGHLCETECIACCLCKPNNNPCRICQTRCRTR